MTRRALGGRARLGQQVDDPKPSWGVARRWHDLKGQFRWFQPHGVSIVAASVSHDLTLTCMLWRINRDAACRAILQTVIRRQSLPHWAARQC
jgi:hypothetical protein